MSFERMIEWLIVGGFIVSMLLSAALVGGFIYLGYLAVQFLGA